MDLLKNKKGNSMVRKINWVRILLSFLIATFLFFLGLLLGFISRGYVSQSSTDLAQSVRNDISNLETAYLLQQDFPCSLQLIDTTSQRLDSLGDLITLLETKKGKFSSDVLELKKLYTVLEVRHFILTEKRNEQCGGKNNIIFFFYSNEEKCQSEVEQTSFILKYVKNKHPEVNIYSFDINLDSDIVKILKTEYKTEQCSNVILNKEELTKLKSASQIEEKLI